MPGRIPTHRPAHLPAVADRHTDYNQNRRDPALRTLYGSGRWKRFRAQVRGDRVLCERCEAEGRTRLGTHVHHKRDPRERPDLAFDAENVELVCLPCHNTIHAEMRGD